MAFSLTINANNAQEAVVQSALDRSGINEQRAADGQPPFTPRDYLQSVIVAAFLSWKQEDDAATHQSLREAWESADAATRQQIRDLLGVE